MKLLSLLNPKKHMLAHALEAVAGKMDPDAKLGFSQGAITPHELAREVVRGEIRGEHFFQAFETVRKAQHQTFRHALHDLVEHPPVLQRRPSHS